MSIVKLRARALYGSLGEYTEVVKGVQSFNKEIIHFKWTREYAVVKDFEGVYLEDKLDQSNLSSALQSAIANIRFQEYYRGGFD